jgi:hypothetical protein
MAAFFTNKYLEMAKECIPTKIANIRRTDKPWLNSEVILKLGIILEFGVEDIEQKNIIYILLCLIHIQLYRL